MKRLKQLRESRNYTQAKMAEMLNTTQQTYGRWETGKATPPLGSLRDMAIIFGTSVDELVSGDERITSTHLCLFDHETSDGYWGNVGVRFDEGKSTWFPVTYGSYTRLFSELQGIKNDSQWLVFQTLNNRVVAFRPGGIHGLFFLEEACDPMEGDWEVGPDTVEGLPLEVYRGLDTLVWSVDLDVTREEWGQAARLLEAFASSTSTQEDRDAWEQFIGRLKRVFKDDASDGFVSVVAEAFLELGLADFDDSPDFDFLHGTTIHLTNGDKVRRIFSPEHTWSFAGEIDPYLDPPIMVLLEEESGDAYHAYPCSKLSGVVMPLIDHLDQDKVAYGEAICPD